MKIDYITNPLGIVKKFDIIYNRERNLHLEGRIIGITEEGYDEANWFEIEVVYPPKGDRRHYEIGGNLNNYQELKRGAPMLEEAEKKLKDWCRSLDFQISEMEMDKL